MLRYSGVRWGEGRGSGPLASLRPLPGLGGLQHPTPLGRSEEPRGKPEGLISAGICACLAVSAIGLCL